MVLCSPRLPRQQETPIRRDFLDLKADARTRTADPFITSEVLYQLSYVGAGSRLAAFRGRDESDTGSVRLLEPLGERAAGAEDQRLDR